MITGLTFSKIELIHVCFTSELKNFVTYCVFGKTWLYIVLHDFNLTYYSSIILGSFSILLFPKLCWHIGLTPIWRHTLLGYVELRVAVYIYTHAKHIYAHVYTNTAHMYTHTK